MGMPTEILERIIANIEIPGKIVVKGEICTRDGFTASPPSWSPYWVGSLLLVSKDFHRVVKEVLGSTIFENTEIQEYHQVWYSRSKERGYWLSPRKLWPGTYQPFIPY